MLEVHLRVQELFLVSISDFKDVLSLLCVDFLRNCELIKINLKGRVPLGASLSVGSISLTSR